MKSFPDRLRAALDRRDIPKYIALQVYNQVCGPSAEDPPSVAWKALRAELQAHILSLRGNKARAHPALRALREEYYDTLVKVNKAVRDYPLHVPIPSGRERWQEWVPKEKRESLSRRMHDAYTTHGVRGNRIVPFAPAKYRAQNLERLARCEAALARERSENDPLETGRGDTPLKALLLCACRQAERAMTAYRKNLQSGEAHPYETPAKVGWQHYCTRDMRARVAAALRGEPIDMEGLLTFYAEPPLVT